ncbi:MAG: hypothetical protein V4731_18175 [Pseudomonadota bacterium]
MFSRTGERAVRAEHVPNLGFETHQMLRRRKPGQTEAWTIGPNRATGQQNLQVKGEPAAKEMRKEDVGSMGARAFV